MFKNKRLILIILIVFFFIPKLVIGQEFTISNYLSSSTSTNTYSIEKVSDGFIVFGNFKGTMDAGSNPVSSGMDMFLIKYNLDFEFQWVRQIGGTLIDFAYDMVVASDESIYFIGNVSGNCSFDGTGTITSSGLSDVLIAKYSGEGTFQWGKFAAYNNAKQNGYSIDVDTNGDLIIGGSYQDSVRFDVSTGFVSPYGIYYAKFDSDGNFIWAKNIITDNVDSKILELSAFSDGYYFNGIMKETINFTSGYETSNNSSLTDIFLFKTDFSGNETWVRRSYSAGGNAYNGSITKDEYGSIYFTGYYSGTQLEVDENASTISSDVLINQGSLDIYVLKYNKTGDLIWANNYGETGEDFARDIKYQNNFLYITGYFTNNLTFGDYLLSSGDVADKDAFIGMIDINGNTLKAVQFTDSNDGAESGMEISADNDNTAIWGGYLTSSSVTIGDSTYNNTLGNTNAFFSKYKPQYVATFTHKENPKCNSSTDGELILTPYFGVPPYTYSWSHNPGLNDSTATGLSAGTYTVTVTDALDSTDVAQYTLTQPAAFTFNPAITQVTTCSYSSQGAINLNVTGGNGGNTYYWFESDGGSGVALTAEDQSGLTTGTYHVTVTDSEGCNADTAILITGPAPVTFGASTNTPYTGADPTTGAIDLELSGGTGTPSAYDASWTGISGYIASTQDITGLDPGNYTVTVTDNNSCQFDTTFSVLDNDLFFAYIADQKDACKGTTNGWAVADYYSPDGSTNISYLWDANAGNQTTAKASNLAAGSYYYVTVTDNDNSVSFTDSVYINQLTYDFEGSLSGTTAVDCKGDSDGLIDLSITSSGITPYTYLWSNSRTTQDIVNLPAGTYSVTVTDANECSFSITNYTITEPEFALAATASIVSQPQCNGDYNGEIRVDANGGNGSPFTFQWNDPASQNTQIADGLDAGTYSVTVTDWKGCKASSGVTLTQPQVLTVSGVIGDLSCYNDGSGTIALTVGGGTTPHSYFWETDTGTGLVATDKNQSGLSAATYHVTITDANLCELEDSFVVAQPDQLQIDSEDQLNITGCFGDNTGEITILASGGTGVLTYTLNPGAIAANSTGLFEDLYSGTYTVEVNDENGCGPLTSNSFEITEPAEIVIDSVKTANASASDASDGVITVYAAGGTGNLEYTLTPGDVVNATGLFENLAPGDYNVNVSDENLCEINSNTITVSFTDNIDLVDLNKYIQIYPNPTSSKITVDINLTDLNDVKIEILSTSGEILESRFVFQNANIREEFDLSAYSKGIYIMRIHSDKVNYTNKIVLH